MDTVDYEALGKRIKGFREDRKMTQEQLAETVNLSPTHISNIETAHTKVSLCSLVAIANELKVSLNDLLEESLGYSFGNVLSNIIDENSFSDEELAIINDVIKALRNSFKKQKR